MPDSWFQRFSDIYRNINRVEQRLGNVILYIDFLPDCEFPVILLKDGSVLALFSLNGLDYEGLSIEQRESYSYYIRSALEQLPDEGAGFMLSNILVRDTPKPMPLVSNPAAPELIQFVQGKKQAFWNDLILQSFSNRIVCGLRYFPVNHTAPPWSALISEVKTHRFNFEQVYKTAETLEQGLVNLSRGFARFGFRKLTREESFRELYRIINFSEPAMYRPDMSLNAQLAHSTFYFNQKEGFVIANETEYMSLIGVQYPPPTSVAMYLKRFYELGFPLVMRQAFGFVKKEKLFKQMDFNLPISMALSKVDPKNLAYVEEVNQLRDRIDNNKELPLWWHFSILVRAKDKEVLRGRCAEVISILKEIGSFGVKEKLNLKAGFFSSLPGHDRFYARRALICTENAGDLMSAFILYPGDTNPVDYLQDRLRGVFSYNPFTQREKAHHRAVCGPTAGGKSFFVIKDLISHLIVNPMIWVVDLSASYLDFFELLREEMPAETAIMRVSSDDTNFGFNPFLLKDPNAKVSDDQFNFCMGLLKLIAGADLMNSENEVHLQNGLTEFFNRYRALLRNQNRETPKPVKPLTILSNIIRHKSQNSALAAAFELWTTGRRGKLFNTGRDTLQDARYCYFDLRDLDSEPELTTAIVYVIFSKVHRDTADEDVRAVQKRFVLDEAHRYIADPAFSYWINLIVRTGRHWNVMLDLITQSINDLQSNAILTNLKQAFMFPGQKNIEESFENLQLSDFHIDQYKKLDAAKYEVLYWSDGGLRRILRALTDPFTYWLATTDAGERTMKKRMKERFGNVRDAITELVRVTEGCQSIGERVSRLETYFGEQIKP